VRRIRTGTELVTEVKNILARYSLPFRIEEPSITGSVINGKQRYIDISVYDPQIDWLKGEKLGKPVMQIECRYQGVSGSAEEKFFLAVSERARDISLGVGSVVVFHGDGFSVFTRRHALLNGCIPFAAFEAWVATYFGFPTICTSCGEKLVELPNGSTNVILCPSEDCQTTLSLDVER